MKARYLNYPPALSRHPQCPRFPDATERVGHLHHVTTHDLERLRRDLAQGQAPPDLEAKLVRLSTGHLGAQFIEQNCRTMIALWLAVHQGAFKGVDDSDLTRFLSALAYVRKDDDAIPDYCPDGFSDDCEEVRAAATDLKPVLNEFKSWRLQFQVPGLWTAVPRRIASLAS